MTEQAPQHEQQLTFDETDVGVVVPSSHESPLAPAVKPEIQSQHVEQHQQTLADVAAATANAAVVQTQAPETGSDLEHQLEQPQDVDDPNAAAAAAVAAVAAAAQAAQQPPDQSGHADPGLGQDGQPQPDHQQLQQVHVQHQQHLQQQQHAAAAWGHPHAQYYPVPGGQVDYLTGEYHNLNGVMPMQPEHAYVTGPGEDYNGVAATLSSWAEEGAAGDNGNGVTLGVPPGANGAGVVGLEHHQQHAQVPQLQNGEQVPPPVVQDKPKKLVLACHFCRGRKLKCDGGRPVCGHCLKRNINCTYDEQVRRRGPGKRTKEMRERAAREAEAAGLGLNPDTLAHLTGEAGPSATLEPPPAKKGRKRKSESLDEAEKKVRLDEEAAAAHAAAAAAAHYVSHPGHPDPHAHAHVAHALEHSLAEHHALSHPLDPSQMDPSQMDPSHMDPSQMDPTHGMDPSQMDPSHSMDPSPIDPSQMDPALTGADGAVLDLPPLEPGTLGQVIQQLNGAQQQQ